MAEGKAGARGPGVPDGWESDSDPDAYRNYASSGRGATTADHDKAAAGEGTSGGGRGTDYAEPAATTRPDAPEFPPEGWGGEGENYPPTRGPLGEPAEDRDG